jgi:hypothetical protein
MLNIVASGFLEDGRRFTLRYVDVGNDLRLDVKHVSIQAD